LAGVSPAKLSSAFTQDQKRNGIAMRTLAEKSSDPHPPGFCISRGPSSTRPTSPPLPSFRSVQNLSATDNERLTNLALSLLYTLKHDKTRYYTLILRGGGASLPSNVDKHPCKARKSAIIEKNRKKSAFIFFTHDAAHPGNDPLFTSSGRASKKLSMLRSIPIAFALVQSCFAATLALHPENPHYFLFRGKPTIVITSGEHYGAVLNLDFDYTKYLDELKAKELNGTRTWSGSYCEPNGAFNIAQNTLAPGPNKFICPWARSSEPGYPNGGNKFDLNKWDETYFKRLKDFVEQASKRGVIVEMNLFCPFYEEGQWKLSPQNAANHINGVGNIARTNAYTLHKNGPLLSVQEKMTRKIVSELNAFDNVYYEICNEPYFGGVTIEWQNHIADVILETEKSLPNKHLISRNVANNSAKVVGAHPAISIFNFHYASPPETVPMNYHLNKVIGDNETGFRGTNDLPYRVEAWAFILAGGGLFNNLDYSFVAGHENGDFVYPKSQPGGGNPVYRKQLQTLKHFMDRFDFIHMKSRSSIVKGVPQGSDAYVLEKEGSAYAIYIGPAGKTAPGKMQLHLQLSIPDGPYKVEWLNTSTGVVDKQDRVASKGGTLELESPEYIDDIALSVFRAE
jgi:hypothetical protein